MFNTESSFSCLEASVPRWPVALALPNINWFRCRTSGHWLSVPMLYSTRYCHLTKQKWLVLVIRQPLCASGGWLSVLIGLSFLACLQANWTKKTDRLVQPVHVQRTYYINLYKSADLFANLRCPGLKIHCVPVYIITMIWTYYLFATSWLYLSICQCLMSFIFLQILKSSSFHLCACLYAHVADPGHDAHHGPSAGDGLQVELPTHFRSSSTMQIYAVWIYIYM